MDRQPTDANRNNITSTPQTKQQQKTKKKIGPTKQTNQLSHPFNWSISLCFVVVFFHSTIRRQRRRKTCGSSRCCCRPTSLSVLDIENRHQCHPAFGRRCCFCISSYRTLIRPRTHHHTYAHSWPGRRSHSDGKLWSNINFNFRWHFAVAHILQQNTNEWM